MIQVRNGLQKAKQFDIATLFPVERVLGSRGFHVEASGDELKTLFKKVVWEPEDSNALFAVFDDRRTRAALLQFIEGTMSNADEDLYGAVSS